MRRAASTSRSSSLAGRTGTRLTAAPIVSAPAARNAATACPWASSRWCAAASEPAGSQAPGACTSVA